MYSIIHKYLVQHHKVSVPGIGSFVIHETPAKFDVSNNQLLHSPKTVIQYNSETALADRVFYNYLAKELHIDEVEAIKSFHEYTYQLKSEINHAESALLPGIGVLRKQTNGSFTFKQEDCLDKYYSTVQLPISNQVFLPGENNHLTLKNENFSDIDLSSEEDVAEIPKDYWWIYAIFLAVLGIAAIGYKFL